MFNFSKNNSKLSLYIKFIIFIKILFIIFAIGHVILQRSVNPTYKNLDEKFVILKKQTEFIFKITMSILLIYYFNPHEKIKHEIDAETTLLFYLFALVMIFTADWRIFFKDSYLLQMIIGS